MSISRDRVNRVVRRTAITMLITLLLTTVTYLEPINPFTEPNFDLTGVLGVAAYWIAASADAPSRDYPGILLIGLPLIALVVIQSCVAWKRRAAAAVAIAAILAVVQGGGAALNEYIVKPRFAVFRPNILALMTVVPSEVKQPAALSALRMSANGFYQLSASERSAYLQKILTPEIPLHRLVRQHWIDEPGYSFPSGHSFSAMLFATFFLAMGLLYCSGRQVWIFYFLVPWALAVCLSRPILRVHSTTDIFVGGLEGLVTGLLAFLLVTAGVTWFSRRVATREESAIT